MNRYLITGGAGFIGSHLAETLVKQGHEVIVVDNLLSGKIENLKPAQNGPGKFTFAEGDIRDLEFLRGQMAGVDIVFHEAARPSVQRSIENPLLTHDINLNGGLNVLKAAAEAKVRRVVSASSSSIYGDRTPVDKPKVETMMPLPVSPYAASKVAMEQYCRAFHKSYGLETVSLRYFNVFGARQDPDSPYAAVIPRFVFSILKNQPPTIFGDGLQSRDFTHISNVVAANLAAAEAPDVSGMAFNVASGVSYSLLDLLEEIRKHTGWQGQPNFGPTRNGDVKYSLADLARTREYLGYEVGIDFQEGVRMVVELCKKGEYLA